MKQSGIACSDQLPPLSPNYPWLVAQNLDGARGHQTFYTLQDQPCHYKCRIPNLLERRIQGYSHGWVILSKKNMWSLWNPETFKIIKLPPLTLKNFESVGQCCLSSPPSDPNSFLLLTITGKPTFGFCQLDFKLDSRRKVNRLKWKRVSYNSQLKEIIGHNDGFLQCLTSYNDKVYAMCNDGDYVIQVDVKVNNGEVLLNLMLHGRRPFLSEARFPISISLLKGSGKELFYITIDFNKVTKERLGNVSLFKWVEDSMRWKEMVDMKYAILFVDLARNHSVYYRNAVVSELGGCIHIRDETGKMMYSYNVGDKSISLSSMAYPKSHMSLWECRLELNKSHLLNLPSHLLELIIDHFDIDQYMSFRATCKAFRLAAPLTKWSSETSKRRLHKYSVASPWLTNVDISRNLIIFQDQMLGDKYYMKRPQVSFSDKTILCSRFGWLLFRNNDDILVFLNPFNGQVLELPPVPWRLNSICFSAPPTSPDCMVVGFTKKLSLGVYFAARHQNWVMVSLGFGNYVTGSKRVCFPTFSGQDLYVLCDKGKVYVFKNLFKLQGYCYEEVAGAIDCYGKYFLVTSDLHLLLVTVNSLYGERDVNVFSAHCKHWENIKSLGRYTIYISSTTCLCVETKIPEMENKIFFPPLYSKYGKIEFYSLDTRRFHTFLGKIFKNLSGVGENKPSLKSGLNQLGLSSIFFSVELFGIFYPF